MLKHAKQLVLHASKRVGLQAATRDSRWRARRLLVLCYHGISVEDEHEWNPVLYMPPATFRRRLEILRNGGYAVLPLDDAVDRLYRGELPPRSVAITFDDGTADFYTQAFPLLREYGFASTVFLTTYYCRYNRPVFDIAISYVIWKGRRAGRLGRDLIGEAGEWRVGNDEERARAVSSIRDYATARGCSAAEKDALLDQVAARLDVDMATIRARRILHLMSESEVADAARHGVNIQLHTHRHRTPREPEAFSREVCVNREQIVRLLGRPQERWHFCYPNGWYHPEFLPWLRRLDVTSATTCEPGIASPGSEPILLPRLVDTMSMSDIEFEGWLSGVSAFLPRRLHQDFSAEADA